MREESKHSTPVDISVSVIASENGGAHSATFKNSPSRRFGFVDWKERVHEETRVCQEVTERDRCPRANDFRSPPPFASRRRDGVWIKTREHFVPSSQVTSSPPSSFERHRLSRIRWIDQSRARLWYSGVDSIIFLSSVSTSVFDEHTVYFTLLSSASFIFLSSASAEYLTRTWTPISLEGNIPYFAKNFARIDSICKILSHTWLITCNSLHH